MKILKQIILLLLIILFYGYNNTFKNLSSECEEYVSFVKEVWEYNDATSTYHFKGNPEYWFESKYIVESCLLGMNKKEIIEIFGKPSKQFLFINYHHFFYCIDEKSLFTFKTTGKEIGFTFNLDGILVKVFVNPPLQQSKNL